MFGKDLMVTSLFINILVLHENLLTQIFLKLLLQFYYVFAVSAM